MIYARDAWRYFEYLSLGMFLAGRGVWRSSVDHLEHSCAVSSQRVLSR